MSTVRLGTGGLSLLAKDGTTLATISTSATPQQAIAELTKAMGEPPSETQSTPGYCQNAFTIDGWGDALKLYHGEYYPVPAGFTFAFSSGSHAWKAIRVEGPGGIAVGESGSALLATTPTSDVDRFALKNAEAANVWVDLRDDGQSGQVGLLVFIESTAGSATVTSISGPAARIGDC